MLGTPCPGEVYATVAAAGPEDVARTVDTADAAFTGRDHLPARPEPLGVVAAFAPFGGVKASGYGPFGGRWGVEAFSNTRWVTIPTQQAHYPF